MESEFLADAGFVCNNVSVLSAMLRNMINMLPVPRTSVPYSQRIQPANIIKTSKYYYYYYYYLLIIQEPIAGNTTTGYRTCPKPILF